MPYVDADELQQYQRCAIAAAERADREAERNREPVASPQSIEEAQQAYAACVAKRAASEPYSGKLLDAALRWLDLQYSDFCDDATALKAKRMRKTMTMPANLADVTRREIEEINQRFPRVAGME